MRKAGALRCDGLPVMMCKYILRQMRKRHRKPAEVTKILEKCTDQDIACDLLSVNHSEQPTDHSEQASDLSRSSQHRNSQSDAFRKENIPRDLSHDHKAMGQSQYAIHTHVTSLSHKCRVLLRRRLSCITDEKSTKSKIESLPLPKPLRDYVACRELISLIAMGNSL